MPQSEGYFIAPSGDIIPVPKNHINMILENPEKFRTTLEELHKVYDQHKEPYGQEGYAREEIMSDLIKEGWIRVRHIPRNDFFTVQVNKLNSRNRDQLYSFAQQAIDGIKGVKFHPETQAKIMDLSGNIIETLTLKEMSGSGLYKEARIVEIRDFTVPLTLKDKIRKVISTIKG